MSASATPPVPFLLSVSPIEGAWYLLTVLLRLGRPTRLTDLACLIAVAPDRFTRFCSIPGSPLLLTDDGFLTVTNSAFAALVRFLSKAVAGPDLAFHLTISASATPLVPFPLPVSPIEKASFLLTVLLRLGQPARPADLASRIAVAPDLFTRLCRIPGSPLLLTDEGFITATNSAVVALVRFLSKAVALSVPRLAITAAGERQGCSVMDSRKRKMPPGMMWPRVLSMDNPEGIGSPSLGWNLPTEVVPYVSRDQEVLENNVCFLSFANDFFIVENRKLLAAERAARVEVGRLKAELQARDSSLAAKEIELAAEKKKADELRAMLDEGVTTIVSKADELHATLDEVTTTVVSKAHGELMMEFKAGPSNERDVETEIAAYQELSRGVASEEAEHEAANPTEEYAKESTAIVLVDKKMHEEKVLYEDSEDTM